jgi:hypothetical protein
VIVEFSFQSGDHPPAEATLDFRSVPTNRPQVEAKEVVGDPVDLPPRPRGVLRDRGDSLDKPRLDQAIKRTREVGPNQILNLVVPRRSRGDGVQDRAASRRTHFGLHDQATLGEQRTPRCSNKAEEVLLDRRVLPPPCQVQRHASY